VFGPLQDPASQYAAVIPKFIISLLAGQPPVIFGDGEQSRDFTYVANVVEANLLAMDACDVAGRVYNVACGERVTLNRLVNELTELIGTDTTPVYAAPRAADIKHSLADISRAASELGYKPTVRLREGLERTIEHLSSRDLQPAEVIRN
jgi:nucleoside-diphosphate-sugar epimerase